MGSQNSGCFRVNWSVDARKLRGNDTKAVSPAFNICLGKDMEEVKFKMIIQPKVMNEERGGASFRKAKGKGKVFLKCEAELPDTAFIHYRIILGEEPRGPFTHNFQENAVCGLPEEESEWDFQAAVSQTSNNFVVCLELQPQRKALPAPDFDSKAMRWADIPVNTA